MTRRPPPRWKRLARRLATDVRVLNAAYRLAGELNLSMEAKLLKMAKFAARILDGDR